jgi:uncharacterized OB-fold protein
MTTEKTYNKPLPLIVPESERYWQGAKDHELWLRYCNDCRKTYFYPRDICPECFSRNTEWRKASGRGTIYSYCIVHRGPLPSFREDAPYVVVLVDIEEGGRMLTNLVDVEPSPDAIKVGMPVEVTFDDVTGEVTLPKFRPAR